jgi:hypothetical protein
MADDFVVETTNERGIVNQEHVSVNQTELDLRWRRLVRIVGLKRATTLQRLNVNRPNRCISGVESHASRRFRSALRQLLRRRASVCARVDPTEQSRRESRSPPFVSSLSLLTPL